MEHKSQTEKKISKVDNAHWSRNENKIFKKGKVDLIWSVEYDKVTVQVTIGYTIGGPKQFCSLWSKFGLTKGIFMKDHYQKDPILGLLGSILLLIVLVQVSMH